MSNTTNEKVAAALVELLRDVERYLATVALFRSEGCEPAWATETTPASLAGPAAAATRV